jgi:glycosyltransferase involved in cell wall biosynthesis
MLDYITPVILTYNEEQNICRTLSQLTWAKDIVVVDSGSTDETLTLIERFDNVRVFTRRFDTHASQWRYATEETAIRTDWILRLDADYQLSDPLVAELSQLDPNAPFSAYRIGFHYSVYARKLWSSLYPSNTVLLRKGCFSVHDEGHTEIWKVSGDVAVLKNRIIHDDWKPAAQWVAAQVRYMKLEFGSLSDNSSGVVRWLRLRPPLMPIAVFLYCLFSKGLVFSGRAGILYALQRMTAEAILSLMVLEERLRAEREMRFDASRSSVERK